jgi:tRNA dimethylallyltransferase
MQKYQELAIIGPTASGKTSLALELANRHNGIILSLDSLAVYRHIDIASAKPTRSERGSIRHFGLDLIDPDQPFDVVRFVTSYQEAHAFALEHHQPLIIVGGSGFYLRTLLEGISPLPPITEAVQERVSHALHDAGYAYRSLSRIDPHFANAIEPSDRYRIEKGLTIYYASGESPSRWFAAHPPEAVVHQPLPIYEITVARPLLRKRIVLRTTKMIRDGLIDEVCSLERTYTRAPNAMKSIGISEVLEYLDGRYSREQMIEKIVIHTARLAKRQVTFNRSQLGEKSRGTLQELRDKLLG